MCLLLDFLSSGTLFENNAKKTHFHAFEPSAHTHLLQLCHIDDRLRQQPFKLPAPAPVTLRLRRLKGGGGATGPHPPSSPRHRS
jgi:hypothetical protein